MILPQSTYVEVESSSTESTSRTYCLDLNQKRILGYTDGVDAMVQAVEKIFNTERFTYEIYSANYGIELSSLIGKEIDFVTAAIQSRIEEALLADSRVLQVQDFEVIKIAPEILEVSCTVITTQGNILARKELNLL